MPYGAPIADPPEGSTDDSPAQLHGPGPGIRGRRSRLRSSYFYAPTVLDRVPADADILRQEIFGPVAPVVRFDDIA